MRIDHPIFTESIRIIKSELGFTGLDPLQQEVLERLIHTSGDFSIKNLLRFSPLACEIGISALQSGAPILTDTLMASSAIAPMASRTLQTSVKCVLDWNLDKEDFNSTRTASGMRHAWEELSPNFLKPKSPIVVIGSSPSALEVLLDLIIDGFNPPSLIIGMPVGFVGVIQSKQRLLNSNCSQIRLEGNRGGAALAAASVNALLRASTRVKTK